MEKIKLGNGQEIELQEPYRVGEPLKVRPGKGNHLSDKLQVGDELLYSYSDGTSIRKKIVRIDVQTDHRGRPTDNKLFLFENRHPEESGNIDPVHMVDGKVYLIRDNVFRRIRAKQ